VELISVVPLTAIFAGAFSDTKVSFSKKGLFIEALFFVAFFKKTYNNK
jgi:hypothetical protein